MCLPREENARRRLYEAPGCGCGWRGARASLRGKSRHVFVQQQNQPPPCTFLASEEPTSTVLHFIFAVVPLG
jgi:hypothetical protein